MKKFVLLILAVAAHMQLNAQEMFFPTPDEHSKRVLDSVKYIVPDFTAATILFDNGTQYNGPINIYTITQKIHFTGDKGELMELANNNEVSRVFIKGRTFLNSRYGFVEVHEAFGDMFMGEIRRVNIISEAKEGAFGSKSQTTSIETINYTRRSNGEVVDITKDKTIPFSYKKEPYIYRKGTFIKASKKGFLKMFPAKKEFIEQYIQENKVDFGDVEEVRTLFKLVATE